METKSGSRLEAARRSTVKLLCRTLVAPEPSDDEAWLELAADRLEDFLAALPSDATGRPLKLTLLGVWAYVRARFGKSPDGLDASERETLLRELCEPETSGIGRIGEWLNGRTNKAFPSGRDLVRALREMLLVTYYSNPASDRITGYTPIWQREEILQADPTLAAPPARLPVKAIAAKHREGSGVAPGRVFANDGRPRVAIIGSGAGGAVAAAKLAETCDVAVFESGPSLRPAEYPMDSLEGLALLYDRGLMSFTKNFDVQLIQGRLVGGGTVVTSGMSIRTRKSTLEAWQRVGIDLDAMRASLDAVEKRLRLEPLEEDLVSDLGRLWRGPTGHENDDLIWDVPKANTATHASQHRGNPHPDDYRRGERCLGCGLCNYGCRFGHKLSVDLTYLPDARAKGARVHPNLGVRRLVAKRDPKTGRTRVVGLVLERDPRGPMLEVDHVVLAAGAVGSPALLLRSMKHDGLLARLPCAASVGQNFGVNYGTTAIADFGRVPDRPGDSSIQIHYVASKPGDERFVLENAFLPPSLLASVVPGLGARHRSWMRLYEQLGMAVTTIGSPQSGSVDDKGNVSYRVGSGEMELIHDSLALLIRTYLRSGARRVGISGVRALDDEGAVFHPGEELAPKKLREKLERIAPTPDRLMLMSAHPQGGLRVDRDPTRGAVTPDFRVHGVENLSAADASLFPSTIVVNPQWTVMALADVAASAIARRIARERA